MNNEKYEYGMGAEKIKDILSRIDIEVLTKKLKEELHGYAASFEDLTPVFKATYPKIYNRAVSEIARRFSEAGIKFGDIDASEKEIDAVLGLGYKVYLGEPNESYKLGQLISPDQETDIEAQTGPQALEKLYKKYREKDQIFLYLKLSRNLLEM